MYTIVDYMYRIIILLNALIGVKSQESLALPSKVVYAYYMSA